MDLLAVQGTLKSLLQHHSSRVSILWCSAFFIIHLSHLYMTTGKNIALTVQTSVSKVMSLLFNMLSRFVIACLPRNKCHLNLWLQSPSRVILSSKKIKSVTVSIVSPSICHEGMALQMVTAAMKLKDTPWKESYDQPRQHIKKQRHYFVSKGQSSQGYGFSSGHVWM